MGGGRKKMKMCFSEMSFLPLSPFFAAAVIEGKIGKVDLEIEERKGKMRSSNKIAKAGLSVGSFDSPRISPSPPPRCKKWGLS